MSSPFEAGWALVDALIALLLWSTMGLALMAQTRALMAQQRSSWLQSQAIEWQADVLERLRLARVDGPVQLAWGQTISASNCMTTPCNAQAWRNSLLADWQQRLAREWPQAQTWLAPWSEDARLQVVGIRWLEAGAPEQRLPVNQAVCPAQWRCVTMLGWP